MLTFIPDGWVLCCIKEKNIYFWARILALLDWGYTTEPTSPSALPSLLRLHRPSRQLHLPAEEPPFKRIPRVPTNKRVLHGCEFWPALQSRAPIASCQPAASEMETKGRRWRALKAGEERQTREAVPSRPFQIRTAIDLCFLPSTSFQMLYALQKNRGFDMPASLTLEFTLYLLKAQGQK